MTMLQISTTVMAVCVLVGTSAAAPVQWQVADGGNGNWYDVVYDPNGITWSDANAAAESMGWHLVTITSAAENAFVFDLVDDDAKYWIVDGGNGLHHGPYMGGFQPAGASEPDGEWTWVTGEPWPYTNWANGQPNNSGGNQNVLLFLGPTSGPGSKWNDAGSGNPANPGHHTYIIEVPESPSGVGATVFLSPVTATGGGAALANPELTVQVGETVRLGVWVSASEGMTVDGIALDLVETAGILDANGLTILETGVVFPRWYSVVDANLNVSPQELYIGSSVAGEEWNDAYGLSGNAIVRGIDGNFDPDAADGNGAFLYAIIEFTATALGDTELYLKIGGEMVSYDPNTDTAIHLGVGDDPVWRTEAGAMSSLSDATIHVVPVPEPGALGLLVLGGLGVILRRKSRRRQATGGCSFAHIGHQKDKRGMRCTMLNRVMMVSIVCVVIGLVPAASFAYNILLNADTEETGSLLGSQPLATFYGTITFDGEIRDRDGDVEFNAAGASQDVFDIDDTSAGAELFFDFDITSVAFVYGGNGGGILVNALDEHGAVVDSFYQANTAVGQPAGPISLSGSGIRGLYWEDPGNKFAALDNIELIVPPTGVGARVFLSPVTQVGGGAVAANPELTVQVGETVRMGVWVSAAAGMDVDQIALDLVETTGILDANDLTLAEAGLLSRWYSVVDANLNDSALELFSDSSSVGGLASTYGLTGIAPLRTLDANFDPAAGDGNGAFLYAIIEFTPTALGDTDLYLKVGGETVVYDSSDPSANIALHFGVGDEPIWRTIPGAMSALPDATIHVVVPEPATLSLLALGGLMLVRTRRRGRFPTRRDVPNLEDARRGRSALV